MPLVEWTDDMSVGVARLDEDHRRLLGMLNTLDDALHRADAQDEVGRALGELIRYTYYHFGAEERLLEEVGYPDLDGHRQAHRVMADHVRQMEADYEANPRSVVATELYKFLSDWLVHHIRSEDMRYKTALARP
ncbi:MAG: bacteriohemerythrin [Pseudomonadota bacterium]